MDQDMHTSNIRRVAKKTGYNHQQSQDETVKLKGKKRLYCAPMDIMDDNANQLDKVNKRSKTQHKMSKLKQHRHRNIKASKNLCNRNTTYKTGTQGMPIRRGWHHYLRHTLRLRYRVKKKHKLESTEFPHPKRNRR